MLFWSQVMGYVFLDTCHMGSLQWNDFPLLLVGNALAVSQGLFLDPIDSDIQFSL